MVVATRPTPAGPVLPPVVVPAAADTVPAADVCKTMRPPPPADPVFCEAVVPPPIAIRSTVAGTGLDLTMTVPPAPPPPEASFGEGGDAWPFDRISP
ncbi:hypothetical protein D3C74_239230 [compost metagenome]